ncbi:MAG: class I SAM-dependent methyltransferase [Bacteroidetes bacterium]|nr:MAG: class I SAM-dependent methyltransferase [Bacteroidota bacterium]
MPVIVSYSSCPLCFSSKISRALVCKDHTVSKQDFEIWECAACALRFTQSIPAEADISPYYQSENYISHSDTSKGVLNTLYKTARQYTLGRKRLFVMQQTGLVAGQIIDVGCGTGAFLNEMRQSGWQVTGLEPDPGARQKAKSLYRIEANESNELFNLPKGYYDAITMWHVLEHVHRLHENIAQIKQLLKPGGKFFIAVPNYTSPDAQHYQQFWAAYDVPRHLYHFTPATIRQLAQQHGMVVTKVKPMVLDSFYISMLSEKYKHGSTRWLSAIWHGLKTMVVSAFNTEKSSSQVYVLEAKLK